MSEVKVKSVPTEYRGIPFRSKLEAKYARALELMGIEYRYEPEVFDLGDGISYCPDFYLPESDVYLEVKGVADGYDTEKIRRFSREKRLLVGFGNRIIALDFPGKVLAGEDAPDGSGEMPSPLKKVAFRYVQSGSMDWKVESGESVWSGDKVEYLVRCPECGTVQFLDCAGGWPCQKCGFYQGDYILGCGVIDEETVLRLVNELDTAPYRRTSVRSCINCSHLRNITEKGCARGRYVGNAVTARGNIFSRNRCPEFETAR